MPAVSRAVPETVVDWSALLESHPMTEAECAAHEAGFARVAGADEAGRGPLAGPLVAAAVVLSDLLPEANDSKLLTERKREELYEIIVGGTHAVGVSIVEPHEIDDIGIQQANYRAMNGAAVQVEPDFVLFDGFEIPGCSLPQRKMIKGDRRSMSIAAASIVAKVTRDRIMYALAERHPEYGFDAHKGYGTRRHMDAIREHGPCPAHRFSFAPIAGMPVNRDFFTSEGDAE